MTINPFKTVPLKDVVYFQEGPGLRNWQYGSSGIPFLNIRTITDEGTIDKSLCQYVKQNEFQGKYEHFLLDEGDFVVSSSGTLGKLAEIQSQDLPLMLNTSVIRFRPLDPGLLHRGYLKWFIKSPLYLRQIQKASTGTAIKNYGPSHLKQMVIPLPPLEEQRRIAAILDRADAVRRKRKEAIALTEELLRSQFLDMFGNPVTNPKGWEVIELGNLITDIESGWSPKCDSREAEIDEWGILKLGAVTWGYFNPSENKALLPDTVPRPELEVKSGDLLFSRKNTYELVGASAFVHQTRSKLLLPDLIFRLCLKNTINPVYLWQVLSQKAMRVEISKLASGSAGSMPNISKARLRTLNLPIPPLNMQLKYHQIVNLFWKQQNHQKDFLQSSENLFNSLLQSAFRGEL